ncbi:MAG: HEAT repeat domain-containing protein [Planctomycetes bacterium]|nr:HEAT repeat domain-containing protein [Planctomycetota bacterium]
MLHRLLTAFVVGLLGFGLVGPTARCATRSALTLPQDGAGSGDGQETGSFEDLVEADKDYSFPPRSGQVAHEALRAGGMTSPRRVAALYTLGETHTSSARAQVEKWMRIGSVEERSAAVFAWGELGSLLEGEDPFLVNALADPELQVAEAALFSLYLSTPSNALDRLAFLVARPDQPLASAADHILQWHERGTCTTPGPVTRRLELRWQAARFFGTIRGQVWTALLVQDLAKDDAFVDRTLLIEAGTLLDPRVPDHLLEWLLLHPAEEAPALAVLLGMPAAMDKLVEQGVWVPQTDVQFESIVEMAESRGLLRLIPGTLARLALQPKFTLRVAGWLVGVDSRYEDGIEGNLLSPVIEVRAQAVRAAGQAGLPEWVTRLRDMSRDPDVEVRVEALIARVREGDRELAWRPLRGFFIDEREQFSDADRDLVLRSMLAAHNGRVLDLVNFIRADLDPGFERAKFTAILLLGGRNPGSGGIRSLLHGGIRTEFWHLKMVQALGSSQLQEDRVFLEKAFPDPASYEVNKVLANALLLHASEEVIPLLKYVVWNGDFNRSSLAAILVSDRFGALRLMQWLERPPVDARSEDLRRLGFMVGSLGGKEALDLLARHLGSAAGAERPELQGALLGVLSARTY